MRNIFATAKKDPNRGMDEYNAVSAAIDKLSKEELDTLKREFEVYDRFMMSNPRRDNNEELALQEVDRVFGYDQE